MFWETFIHFYERLFDEFLAQFRSTKFDISKRPILKSLVFTFLSAVLLTLSFPKYNIWIFAWIGLIPFMYAIDGKDLRKAFGIGYVLGLLFFTGTVYWVAHVTILGIVLMILYLSVYFGLFAIGYAWLSNRRLIVKLFAFPSLWVVLEYLRGHLLTGFGWASLAHSQYQNLHVIQIADVTGMLGVSFLIVMVNFFLKEFIAAYLNRENNKCAFELSMACIICIFLVNISLLYGFFKVNRDVTESPTAYVAVVQGNIPLLMRWNKHAWPFIVDKYIELTKHAIAKEPDLIDLVVWPETAYPGYLWEEKELLKKIKSELAPYNKLLLFGAVTKRENDYFNSAVLISPEKERPVGVYNKLHLVPFGEYIPYRKQFPFLQSIVPIDDFTPGNKHTVFQFKDARNLVDGGKIKFSTLICFEDAVAEISRQFTKEGAHFLVNITNDAWFQDTKAPWMHVQSSVFRAVENRRPVVRAANTGVSSFIGNDGRIFNIVSNTAGKQTFVAGYSWGAVSLDDSLSFYTRFGDIFTYLCFGCILSVALLRRKGNEGQ